MTQEFRSRCLMTLALVGCVLTQAMGITPPADLMEPIGNTLSETQRQVCPGVEHIHRTTDDPLNINVLLIDVREPGISIRVCLAQDHAAGLETVRSMAVRKGAIAAVNGDYWTNHGIPLGLTVVDGEIVIAPKYRTAFGILRDETPVIGRWTNGWSWDAAVVAPGGATHELTMMNSDCGERWLCLYTDRYGLLSKGNSVSPVTEVVCNLEHRVLEVRTDRPGIEIPSGGFVLTGRDEAGEWLRDQFKPGDWVRLNLRSSRPWQELKQAIGAGPRILKEGRFYQDSLEGIPAGEEFPRDWKEAHYYRRHPRTAAGISRNADRVILIAVDGRQMDFSAGVYQKQMADLLMEFGAWDGMDLDSGGSTTMVIEGELVNYPSDHSKRDGTGGRERRVSNSLQVFYEPPANKEEMPDSVDPEQLKLNIEH